MTNALDPFDESTWSDEQRGYFELVDGSLGDSANAIISNGKPEHAVFLIHRFLSNAKESVRLFSGRLSRAYGGVEVYGDAHVADAAAAALKSGVAVRIVLEEEMDAEDGDPENHPLVRLARGMEEAGTLAGSLEIHRASEPAREFLSDFPYHWMTMDGSAYRLETETDKATAHVNFGDPDMVSSLSEIFDNVLLSNGAQLVRIAG